MQVVPENKAYLTAHQILGATDLPSEEVEVPEWGGTVIVRGMSAGERLEYAALFTGEVMPTDVQARMAQMCIVDLQGAQVFTRDQIAELSGKSATALERVTVKAMELSGMTEDAGKK